MYRGFNPHIPLHCVKHGWRKSIVFFCTHRGLNRRQHRRILDLDLRLASLPGNINFVSTDGATVSNLSDQEMGQTLRLWFQAIGKLDREVARHFSGDEASLFTGELSLLLSHLNINTHRQNDIRPSNISGACVK